MVRVALSSGRATAGQIDEKPNDDSDGKVLKHTVQHSLLELHSIQFNLILLYSAFNN